MQVLHKTEPGVVFFNFGLNKKYEAPIPNREQCELKWQSLFDKFGMKEYDVNGFCDTSIGFIYSEQWLKSPMNLGELGVL